MKKILLLILFLCIGCLSPETKNAINVFDKASREAKKFNIGDSEAHKAIAEQALKHGVESRYFRYCTLERIEQGKAHHHRVLLLYAWDYPVIVTSTGAVARKSFICLEEANELGWYPVQSWQKFDDKLHVWKHEKPETEPIYSASPYHHFSIPQSIGYSKNYWNH